LKRVVVLGAGGMLAHKLCADLPARGFDILAVFRQPAERYARYEDVFGRVRTAGGIDAMDWNGLRTLIERERPFAVVNCVGVIKQLDMANQRRLAVGLNAYLPHVLERICGDAGARLVHFSTDCVFSGRKGMYREADVSDAEDTYGRTKYLGETDGLEGDAVTLRTSIIGRELRVPVHGLFEWFLAQRGRRIRGFARAIYSGFPTREMSRIVARVLEREAPLKGVYQVASDPISKYDLLVMIKDMGRYSVEIERDVDFLCDRSLVMDRFTEDTGYRAPSWDEMIRDMLVDPTPYDAYRQQGYDA